MGRLIGSIVQAKEYSCNSSKGTAWEHLSPKSANSAPPTSETDFDLSRVPTHVAERLFRGYIRHISTRWPVLQTPQVQRLHVSRDSLSDTFKSCALHLIYAIGGRFLETTGETGDFFPDKHYEEALKYLDEILRYHDLRSVSIILGRPFAISDRDIDVELPFDINEAFEDSSVIERAAEAAAKAISPGPQPRSTSMTGFIHICRLRIIESNIQQSIYRVDRPFDVTETDVEHFIRQLDEWKANMPNDARNRELPNVDSMCVDGYDYYMVYYYKCLRYLLHPVILSSDQSDTRFLRKCAEACGGVCRTYKKLHQTVPVGFSVMALHSVFLAGLTLIYCVWASPKELFNTRTSNDMNACSIVLYIITERWPGARQCRDAYESIKQSVLDSIEDSEYQPRKAVTNLRPGLQAALQTVGQQEEGNLEFTALVTNMAGGPAAMALGEDRLEALASLDCSGNDLTFTPFNFALPLDGMFLDFHGPEGMSGMDMHMDLLGAAETPGPEWMGVKS
ncbi:hypothetical protein NKR23_g6746 [Pleurostoma richardsiae]|uniref:Xylanolytic transcriptional activator regulatory domain-containing protein n=1 Tax=Pleurostoma richardsiae TaxID=41990 RepID=A0AA38VRS2_9PEZI|nr:hypothetical protein NKR23_g6746 [Pleurostoma richardsiae]